MGEKVEREVYALTDLEMMCEKYYKYVNSYALSLCCDETLAEDIDRVAAVRELIGPDITFMVDANMKWSVEEAVKAYDQK